MVWVLLLSMAMPNGGVAIEKFAYYSTEGECIKARTIFGKDGKSQTPRNSACPLRSRRKSAAHHYKISSDDQGNPEWLLGGVPDIPPWTSYSRFPRTLT
jgi:hypothetical protein